MKIALTNPTGPQDRFDDSNDPLALTDRLFGTWIAFCRKSLRKP